MSTQAYVGTAPLVRMSFAASKPIAPITTVVSPWKNSTPQVLRGTVMLRAASFWRMAATPKDVAARRP